MIVTRNHEYYVSGGICFAERDRASGRYMERHASIGVAQPLAMPTDDVERDAQNASWIPPAPDTKPRIDALTIATPLERTPRAGEWVCLQHSGALHCTGPVLAVERRATRVAR